ncbi:Protein RESTRICTED TEV MOVEMENT 2 [Morella rubra]|uniref:Protein RESTRICTED TEV MOVEMENT 2 n=1 Tax=Morella rubra TaxID=262757 RepID=A0A6A1WJK9_9ROSI|nr:Protein RESTRICTED TEV MOVEMENT 2 [Morella rubra]
MPMWRIFLTHPVGEDSEPKLERNEGGAADHSTILRMPIWRNILPWWSNRPMDEDFQPKSERNEGAAADTIVIHLPAGFVKERVRITYIDSTRMIRAQGERSLGNNRWSRFNQTYSVPENCDADKIQSKFEQGILTITMPKKIVEQVVTAPEEAKSTQEVPRTDLPLPPPPPAPLEELPPERPTSTYEVEKQREEKLPQPQIPIGVTTVTKVLQNATEDTPPEASTSTAPEYERRRVVEIGQSKRQPAEATTEEAQKGLHIALPKAASTIDVQKPIDKTSMKSTSEDPGATYTLVGTSGPEHPRATYTAIEYERRRVVEIGQPRHPPEATQKSKRLNEEERQMLVNVGAAVLVIVAIGACVYYSRRSSGSVQAED